MAFSDFLSAAKQQQQSNFRGSLGGALSNIGNFTGSGALQFLGSALSGNPMSGSVPTPPPVPKSVIADTVAKPSNPIVYSSEPERQKKATTVSQANKVISSLAPQVNTPTTPATPQDPTAIDQWTGLPYGGVTVNNVPAPTAPAAPTSSPGANYGPGSYMDEQGNIHTNIDYSGDIAARQGQSSAQNFQMVQDQIAADQAKAREQAAQIYDPAIQAAKTQREQGMAQDIQAAGRAGGFMNTQVAGQAAIDPSIGQPYTFTGQGGRLQVQLDQYNQQISNLERQKNEYIKNAYAAAVDAANTGNAARLEEARALMEQARQADVEQKTYSTGAQNMYAQLQAQQQLQYGQFQYAQNIANSLLSPDASGVVKYPTEDQITQFAQQNNINPTVLRAALNQQYQVAQKNQAAVTKAEQSGIKYFTDSTGKVTKVLPDGTQVSLGELGKSGNYSESDVKSIADGIENGTLPPDVKGMYGMAPKVKAELERRGFNFSKANLDYQAIQKYTNTMNSSKIIQLRSSAQTAYESLDLIDSLNQQLTQVLTPEVLQRSGYPTLNKAAVKAAKNGLFGEDAASIAIQLDAQISDVVSEIGTVYRGGNASTNESLKLASEQLSSDWSQKVLSDSIDLARKNLKIRLNSYDTLGAFSPTSATELGSNTVGTTGPSQSPQTNKQSGLPSIDPTADALWDSN